MSANSRLTTAVHALCWLELARRGGRSTLISAEIADSLASHPVLVRRTLAPLRNSGLLEVLGHGPGAGWRLTVPASEMSLADVHAALGEQTAFDLHSHEPKQACPVGRRIGPVLRDVYSQVDVAITRSLAGWTIANVLDTTLAEHSVSAPATSQRLTGYVGVPPAKAL